MVDTRHLRPHVVPLVLLHILHQSGAGRTAALSANAIADALGIRVWDADAPA